MNKKYLIVKIIVALFFIGLMIVCLVFNTLLKSDHEEKLKLLKSKVDQVESAFVTTEDGDIHFVRSGDTSKELVLLIHGSPGSWDAWMEVMSDIELLKKYYFISVDRPGYGLTTIPSKSTLLGQAKAIYSILDKRDSKAILIGHSYGGAIVQQLALDFPEQTSALIYVAATLEPSAQKPKWYNYFAKTKIIFALLSKMWKSSGNEMMGLAQGLQSNESKLKDLEINTHLIQGMKDVLVPSSVVDYYKKVAAEDYVEYIIDNEQNHFIPWTKPSLIKEVLLKLSNPNL